MLLCFIEVLAHTGAGTLTYIWLKKDGKKTIYHPGFATSWMLFLPAGCYLASHLENVTANDWLWCAILFVIMMLICMAVSGISIQTLSYLMGHSSIEVTADVYTHIKTEDAKVELDKVKGELDRINKEADKVLSMPRMA